MTLRADRILLAFAAAAFLAGATAPVLSEDLASPNTVETEPLVQADTAKAEQDGYTILDIGEKLGSKEREIVEREFMARLGERLGRSPPYSFDFELIDLTGDGYKDLVLFPRVAGFEPADGELGAPVLVYVFDGKAWQLALQSSAMTFGVRKHVGRDGRNDGTLELALVDAEGYRRFVWEKGSFVRKAPD